MFSTTESLYDELAKALGVPEIPVDDDGSVELSVDETPIILFAEDADSLMLVAPVGPLPAECDYGAMLWLLRRNFHDSPIAPFRIACDASGNIMIWGRMPLTIVDGEALADLIDALAEQSNLVRDELGMGEEQDE